MYSNFNHCKHSERKTKMENKEENRGKTGVVFRFWKTNHFIRKDGKDRNCKEIRDYGENINQEKMANGGFEEVSFIKILGKEE